MRTKLYIYVFITQIVTYFVIPNNKINTSGICFQVSEWFLLAAKRAIFVSYMMERTSYILRDDDGVDYVLDQDADLGFCTASSP